MIRFEVTGITDDQLIAAAQQLGHKCESTEEARGVWKKIFLANFVDTIMRPAAKYAMATNERKTLEEKLEQSTKAFSDLSVDVSNGE